MRFAGQGLRSAVLLISVVALGACSRGGDAPEVSASPPTAEQEARWALPMDSYVMNQIEVAVYGQAEDYLVKDCMATQGQSWDMAAFSESQLSAPVQSPSGLRIFDEKIAQTYGYTFPPVYPADVAAERTRLNRVTLTDAQQAAFKSCLQEARDRLGPMSAQDLSNQMSMRLQDIWTQATSDGAVATAAEQWRSCMAPQGIPDLPDAPYGHDAGMPTASQFASWGISPADSASGAAPSAAEIAAAMADAACRTSSGYTDALYQAEWRLQVKALHDDASLADDGQRARQTYDKVLADCRAVIAAHGGA